MKTIFIFLILTFSIVSVFGQKADTLNARSYRMEFVFTGEVRNKVDSVFALQYSFFKKEFRKYKAVNLEDSKKTSRIRFSQNGKQNNVQVKDEPDRIKVIVLAYDKYDIPIPTVAEDSSGRQKVLYLQTSQGKYIHPGAFKAHIQKMRSAQKQNQTDATQKN